MPQRYFPPNLDIRDFFGHPEEYDEERFRQYVRDLTGDPEDPMSYQDAYDFAEEHFDRTVTIASLLE